MPIVVDKDAERLRILDAFQDCLSEKPFDKITLRDIANRARMPHPTVLTYFHSRKEIVIAYVDYIADRSVRQARQWVEAHHSGEYTTRRGYIKALLSNAAKFDGGSRLIYTGALNTYILAQYEPEVAKHIRDEFKVWTLTLQDMLFRECGISDPAMAHFVLDCLEGICLNTYNGLLDAATYDRLLDIIAGVLDEESKKR